MHRKYCPVRKFYSNDWCESNRLEQETSACTALERALSTSVQGVPPRSPSASAGQNTEDGISQEAIDNLIEGLLKDWTTLDVPRRLIILPTKDLLC